MSTLHKIASVTDLEQFKTLFQTIAARRAFQNDIMERWETRMENTGWEKLGKQGAKNYLKSYGRNISMEKLVGLAHYALVKGRSDISDEFWQSALELGIKKGAVVVTGAVKERKPKQVQLLDL